MKCARPRQVPALKGWPSSKTSHRPGRGFAVCPSQPGFSLGMMLSQILFLTGIQVKIVSSYPCSSHPLHEDLKVFCLLPKCLGMFCLSYQW